MSTQQRRRRETITIADLSEGDEVQEYEGGYRNLKVEHIRPHHRVEGALLVDLRYPNDFTVNARSRGRDVHWARWPSDEVTRWRRADQASHR